MKRDGESVRFVADPLNEKQRRIVRRERDGLRPVAREEQLFLLRNPDRDQVRQP